MWGWIAKGDDDWSHMQCDLKTTFRFDSFSSAIANPPRRGSSVLFLSLPSIFLFERPPGVRPCDWPFGHSALRADASGGRSLRWVIGRAGLNWMLLSFNGGGGGLRVRALALLLGRVIMHSKLVIPSMLEFGEGDRRVLVPCGGYPLWKFEHVVGLETGSRH